MQSTYSGKDTQKRITRPVSSQEWTELTQFIKINNHENANKYISEISILHNMDKKQILLGYMNHILRKYTHYIGKELISVFENVSHSSDDMPCDDLVSYFVSNIIGLVY
jgi:wyosine [tRNA(Phe)-imidazoG37] synthetase (radical SAM superfamily)